MHLKMKNVKFENEICFWNQLDGSSSCQITQIINQVQEQAS
jgi:hypothetical protein